MGDETVSEKKRCVIVGGADIGDYARVKQYLRADDAIVFCDSGLKHMEARRSPTAGQTKPRTLL